jgi:sugar O-acyltransferase (sialic acid O-acetyltransferase NeuD family)
MEKIGLIGYGELGQQFEHMIQQSYINVQFYYFDDIALNNVIKKAFSFDSYLDNQFSDLEFLVGLGYKNLEKKKEIIDSLIKNKRNLYTFIHPTAFIDTTAKIDKGTVIYPHVVIDKDVNIGIGCVLNLSVTIAHNCKIGDCSFLAPSVTLSGFVKIGSLVFIGTGACVTNKITIENNAIVGIGSVITKNIEKNQSVIGNPQKVVKEITLF